jgi:lipoprotein-anchoring transpeptidase ErfK/SrfK
MSSKKFSLDPDSDKRLKKYTGDIPDILLHVNIQSQSLYLVKKQIISSMYRISTSRYGTGSQNNSFKTPLGIHRIVEKIGAGAPHGRIFRDRKDTGEDWHNEMTEENLILTRILRLEGLEPDINRGEGIDSYERYIYIHGTNREDLIGTPMSHGCICMKNNEIIELFDTVPENTIVIIN